MIVLHQFAISPFCDKVRRALHHKKVQYETREVPLIDVTTGALRRKTGTGKVPALEHDGRLVVDSTDIVRYLDERFPEKPLIPKDARHAAYAHVLEDWADESLYFLEVYFRFMVPENAKRWIPELVHADPLPIRALAPVLVPRTLKGTLDQQGFGRKSKAQLLGELDRHLDSIEAMLAGASFLVANALSVADLAVFAQLFAIRGAREGAEAIARRPGVVSWMERVDGATPPP
jgi:glutathione S-transferase